MARIDDLIAQVTDKALRQKLQTALADMKKRQRFGLVYEEHVPETTTLFQFPIQVGATAQRRSDLEGQQLYVVKGLNGSTALLEPEHGGPEEQVPVDDLCVIKRFGDPVFPALIPLGGIARGGADRPHHALIKGENFHTLQLLVYMYEGQFDCIYIDPPYNTGARDWKYNNRYVDKNDAWRHSKWLSMMEKRLRIAKRLLKPDGVLICTIDDYEVNHLGMLLEKVFPEFLHYMLTIVINPKGRAKANFAPVDEKAYFVIPDTGEDLVLRAPGAARTGPEDADEEDVGASTDEEPTEAVEAEDDEWEYRHARRRGGGAEMSSYRRKRPNQFYPIYIDEEARKVVRVGEAIPLDKEPSFKKVKGLRPIWPIDTEGQHRVWAFVPSSMEKLIEQGNVLLGRYHKARDDWTINYRIPKKNTRKLKTVWWEKAHDAGTHGTELLSNILGAQGLFPFPKSVYAVKDCLAAVVRQRPEALILDFFAGSGTTLHATCLLNAEDGGSRRAILVTNNEVDEETARQLTREGIYPRDPEFERHGIFEQATRPRSEAVITGLRPGGTPIPGNHIGGQPLKQGFEENLMSFRLEYVDADDVELGTQINAILPSLWLAAGGVGVLSPIEGEPDMHIPEDAHYGVLFREERFRRFSKALAERPDITHIWIVTDSEDAFAEMRAALPSYATISMLYRDYLRNFRINTRHNV